METGNHIHAAGKQLQPKEETMAVLTIARELGSIGEGEELTLCRQLKLHCINKATLQERFKTMGIDPGVFERFDECHPGFTSFFNTSSRIYWEALQTVLLKELLSGNVAIIGRGGNFLLKNLVDGFRIRLTAPLDVRICRLCGERNCSESEALKAIRQSDSAREKFCRYYYSADWKNPLGYDMVINTAELSLGKIAEILPGLLPPPAEGARKEFLECAVKEQMIRHTLFSAWNYQMMNIDIKYTPDGTVILRGSVNSEEAAEHCENIVKAIPGVKKVQNELFVIFADTGIPMY